MNRLFARACAVALALACVVDSVAAPAQPGAARPAARVAGETVNINSADAETIADVLVGIGPAKAEAIVAHRKAKGPFRTLEQLSDVEGVSTATVNRNRGRMVLR